MLFAGWEVRMVKNCDRLHLIILFDCFVSIKRTLRITFYSIVLLVSSTR